MNAYSKDLRLKVLSAIGRGIPRKELQDLFGVSRSTIKRWLNRRRQTGNVDIHKIPGRPPKKGEALRQWLPEQLKSNPDLTLREHCEAFEDESGVEVSEATMSRNIEPGFREGGHSKKVADSFPLASERDEGARALWRWLVSRFELSLGALSLCVRG
jgi:transposase